MPNIFIVIPSFNEYDRLDKVISNLTKHAPPSATIVVVDDGSARPVNKSKKYLLLRHTLNQGKGSAMKTGAEYAFKNGAQAVIFMDADGQHEAKYIPQFASLFDQGFQVVLGSRRMKLETPLTRMLGNKLISIYINLLFGVYVSDILSGFRLISKSAYKSLYWTSQRYGVETEMIARLGKNKKGLKWTEIPIEPVYIDKYKGMTIIDAIKILFDSIWWKLF